MSLPEGVQRLSDWMDRHAAATPRAEAGVEGQERQDYATLAGQSHALGAALGAAGLRPGDRVGFLGSPGLDFLVAYMAVTAAGAVWLGLNPKQRAAELSHVLGDAAPRLVLVGNSVERAAEGVLRQAAGEQGGPPVVRFDRAAPHVAALPAAKAPPLAQDVAMIVYTSGTTGKPKGAMLRHAGVLRAADIYASRLARAAPRVLHNLPINHVGGLIDVTAPALQLGGTLVMMPRFEPEAIPGVLQREAVTNWGQVPVMFEMVDATGGLDGVALPALATVIWSGAAMPRACLARLRRYGVDFLNCYGLTETTGSVTLTDLGDGDEVLLSTVGRPAEPENLRLWADSAAVGEAGGTGEIQVRGELVMAGYHGDPAATSAAFTPDGWLRTGDLGCLTPEGCLRLVGRTKEMFKSGGYNVYPREVELALEDCPDVELAAVLGVADPRWGEVGHAFVLSRAAPPEAVLEAWCRERLANYKVPKRFTVAAELPLLPIGKVDKQALRQSLDAGPGPLA